MFRSCPPQAGHLELLHVFPPVLVCMVLALVCIFGIAHLVDTSVDVGVGRAERRRQEAGPVPKRVKLLVEVGVEDVARCFPHVHRRKKQQRALRERELTAALWFSCCSLCKIAPVQGKYQSSNGMESDVEKC